LEFGIWELGFGIWDLEFGIWNLGFGIWDLEFGIWNLGFGIIVVREKSLDRSASRIENLDKNLSAWKLLLTFST
jgi:hypothetical protein